MFWLFISSIFCLVTEFVEDLLVKVQQVALWRHLAEPWKISRQGIKLNRAGFVSHIFVPITMCWEYVQKHLLSHWLTCSGALSNTILNQKNYNVQIPAIIVLKQQLSYIIGLMVWSKYDHNPFVRTFDFSSVNAIYIVIGGVLKSLDGCFYRICSLILHFDLAKLCIFVVKLIGL